MQDDVIPTCSTFPFQQRHFRCNYTDEVQSGALGPFRKAQICIVASEARGKVGTGSVLWHLDTVSFRCDGVVTCCRHLRVPKRSKDAEMVQPCAIRMSLWMTDPTFGQDRVGIPMDHQLSELMLDHRKKRVKRVAKAPPAERQTNANFIQFLSDWWTRLEDVGSYSQKTWLFGVVQE